MRKWISLALVALMLLCWTAGAEGSPSYLGEAMPDFTVETIDGGSFTLSEALEDHDMVLINLWATWCVYCELEFPYLQEAYERYGDRVAVIALSLEPGDTMEVMSAFAAEKGLTFPIGSELGLGLAEMFEVQGIPMSIVVDRFGDIAYAQAGAMPDAEAFCSMFEYFLNEDYSGAAG